MAKLQSVNRERFGDIWKLRGGFLGVWKLGIVAHEKLRVCNRVFCETSGCFRETSGCFLGCVGGGSVCVHGCVFFVRAFFRFFLFYLFRFRAFWVFLSLGRNSKGMLF